MSGTSQGGASLTSARCAVRVVVLAGCFALLTITADGLLTAWEPELLESANFHVVDALGKDFIWGTATASYQVEGAFNKDGRGPTVWDEWSHEPGRTNHNDNGDVADDQYHRYEEDFDLLEEMGVKHYRMSLAWSRIMPTGELPVNDKGIEHYHKVFDALHDRGIEPLVTLFHWDLPLALEQKYGGWLNSSISHQFADYADVAFKEFGGKVKSWLTINEPWTVAHHGYAAGFFPPGRCSDRVMCAEGDSGRDPYTAAHSMLLAHARASDVYNRKYRDAQGGKISITLNCDWAEGRSSAPADQMAADRFVIWQLGWFSDPVFFGEYPKEMRDRLGDRLPSFTVEESALLRSTSPPFLGLNHYSTNFAYNPVPDSEMLSLSEAAEQERDSAAELANSGIGHYDSDSGAAMTNVGLDGKLIGETADSPWLHVVPWGFRKLLGWVYNRYEIPIMVTENGCDVPGESAMSVPFVLRDPFRINYYAGYISAVNDAVKYDNVPIIGYFAWSLVNNLEWADGYSKHFGLVYVDYATQARYPKASASWFAKLIRVHELGADEDEAGSSAPPKISSSEKSPTATAAPSAGVQVMVLLVVLLMMALITAVICFRMKPFSSNRRYLHVSSTPDVLEHVRPLEEVGRRPSANL